MRAEAGRWSEIAPAKLNLALHVRGKLPDGRHKIETLFAFCTDGDRLTGEPAEELELTVGGRFAADLGDGEDNLVLKAARALREAAETTAGASLHLTKNLPVASGIGGGSADAAAALRLLTSMWRIDPGHAARIGPELGADVPACLLSMTARGEDAGDALQLAPDAGVAGMPVLLVNPGHALSTREVFAGWDGEPSGPLGDWREGRNDLQAAAVGLVPAIADVLAWLEAREGADVVRMSGSGATCFALFGSQKSRDRAALEVPEGWWHLATELR